MTEARSTAQSARPRPQFRLVRVASLEQLTPHRVRIAFAGAPAEQLAGFQIEGPSQHIKMLFPAPGQAAPSLPTFGPTGPVYPEGEPRPPMRTYTPRHFDSATGLLTVDFILHTSHVFPTPQDVGPASVWAAQAQVGDVVAVAGPRGGYHYPDEAAWFLLAGDESALPAIETILETLPASAHADVYIEVTDLADEYPLASKAHLAVTWIPRAHDDSPGQTLETLIRAAQLPSPWLAGRERLQAWVACEASAMRRIRKHLLEERNWDPQALYTRGYWKVGEANHPDHDTGEDA